MRREYRSLPDDQAELYEGRMAHRFGVDRTVIRAALQYNRGRFPFRVQSVAPVQNPNWEGHVQLPSHQPKGLKKDDFQCDKPKPKPKPKQERKLVNVFRTGPATRSKANTAEAIRLRTGGR
ncbi:hypothetical protein [Mycobacterium sp. 29Ha]|uniref:hypothetical protein n=1 Tax=Mycobacterium sp. 29Ha TaxID=2939268 RepID=UPI002938DFC8|nr:hypothetical protein [Mycobacterium sp. 29Ha]MDV3135323.1 hypothetical protein [Mycobacterium sp. 29Ha]